MPHVITRHQPSGGVVFFAEYDRSYVVKVTDMGAGGMALGNLQTLSFDSGSIYAASANGVGTDEIVFGPQNSYMNISTDSGSTWNRTYAIGSAHFTSTAFFQAYYKDLTSDLITWHGTSDHVTGIDYDNVVAFYTKDGGTTWNRVLLETLSGWAIYNIFAVPAHDGRYAYIVATQVSLPSHGTYRVKIYKVDSTDGSFTTIIPTGAFTSINEQGFLRGSVKKGTPDKLYLLTADFGSLWTVVYSTNTATLIYDGNGPSKIEVGQSQHKQFICSPSGTLLWVLSDTSLSLTPILHIWRSTDGTNWTLIDCTSLAPSGNRGAQWDFIAFSGSTLFMAFEQVGGVVFGMYSTDDGATWQRTGNLYTGVALTAPLDNTGVLAGG